MKCSVLTPTENKFLIYILDQKSTVQKHAHSGSELIPVINMATAKNILHAILIVLLDYALKASEKLNLNSA